MKGTHRDYKGMAAMLKRSLAEDGTRPQPDDTEPSPQMAM